MESDEDESGHSDEYDFLILHGDLQAELAETVCRNIRSAATDTGRRIRFTVRTFGSIFDAGMQESDIFDNAIEKSKYVMFFRCETFFEDTLNSFAVSATLYDRISDKDAKKNYTLIPLDIDERTKVRGKILINGLQGFTISASGEIRNPEQMQKLIRKCHTRSQTVSSEHAESLIRQQIEEAETRQLTEISKLVNSALDFKRDGCFSQEKQVSEDDAQSSSTHIPLLYSPGEDDKTSAERPGFHERRNEESGPAARNGTETSSPPNSFSDRPSCNLARSVEVDYPQSYLARHANPHEVDDMSSLLGTYAELPTPSSNQEQWSIFPSPGSSQGLSRGHQQEARCLPLHTSPAAHNSKEYWNKKGARPKTFSRRQETVIQTAGPPLRHEEYQRRNEGLQSGTLSTGDGGLVPAGHAASQEVLETTAHGVAQDHSRGDTAGQVTAVSSLTDTDLFTDAGQHGEEEKDVPEVPITIVPAQPRPAARSSEDGFNSHGNIPIAADGATNDRSPPDGSETLSRPEMNLTNEQKEQHNRTERRRTSHSNFFSSFKESRDLL